MFWFGYNYKVFKGVAVQTIHLEVKDDYVKNLLVMLNSLKDIMIEKIDVETPEKETLTKLQETSMSKTWDNEEDKVWDEL